MPDAEMVLAMTGATTVVAAMATSAWETARAGMLRLFRHGGEKGQAAVAAELDDHAALVARAEDAAVAEAARRGLGAAWEVRLADLLRRNPDTRQELGTLVDQIGALLPQAEQMWVQTNIARDGGQNFAAQGGNVIVHQNPPAADAR